MDYSTEAITERIKNRLKNPASKIEGSFAMDNVQAVASSLAEIVEMEILPIYSNVFLDTAEGIMLDRKALDFHEKRIEAQAAHGYLEFEGTEGVTVVAGTQVTNGFEYYETIEDGVIPISGKLTLKARCSESGISGNSLPNTITELIPSIVGISAVKNPQAFEGGTDPEPDEHFRQRILEKIQRPITSGNANHYEYWAKQVPGVGAAKVIPCWAGNGTVKVIVISDKGESPDNSTLEAVKNYIESNRPIGATVTVAKAMEVSVDINISLILSEGYSLPSVKKEITDNLSAYLKSIAFDTSKNLSYYKVGDIIFDIPGIKDITAYTVCGGTASITPEFEEYFKLREVTVNGS